MIEYITLSDLVKKVSQDAVEKGKEKRCVTYEHLGFRTYKRSEIQELYSKWGAIFLY